MSFLVAQEAPNNTTMVTVVTEGLVPMSSKYWWLETPADLMRAQKRISSGFIGGNYYEKGARYGFPLVETADLISQVLGPTEDERRATQPKSVPIWLYVLWAVASAVVAGVYVGLFSIAMIMLIPLALFFLWKR